MILAHLTDLHVRPVGLPAYRVAETNMYAARAVDAVLALDPAPDAVVISGDLTDNGLVSEYENLKAILARLPMPVWLVPGNHDRRENLKGVFADWPGMGQHDKYAQWSTMIGPLRVIGLDTVIPESGAGRLCPRRLEWLQGELAAAPEAPTVIVMHHPPYDCGIRHMDRIRLLEGVDEFEAIVRANPQIVRILCGHHHRPIQAIWAGVLTMVGPSVAHQVTLDLTVDSRSSLNFEPAAFHLHAFVEGAGLVSHTAYVEKAPGPYPFLRDPDYPGAPKA